MPPPSSASNWFAGQARSLLTRLARVEPFALHVPSVAAAAISPRALRAIDGHLATGRRELRERVNAFLSWLDGPEAHASPAAEGQRRFAALKLRFNDVLSQFDLFADVLAQRSEHGTGVWLAGLDVAANDALTLADEFYVAPPVACYLDRGPGGAIRRARTRLPGGSQNPVSVIRIPRERMVGTGIAASLVHEVGHQGAALLDLLASLRPLLLGMQQTNREDREVWSYWERWISEIVADLWAVAQVGVAGTLGLMGVVSLPGAFVFRLSLDDPHPAPWIRVKLSCAFGNALYPHPQWRRLVRLWEALYPPSIVTGQRRATFDALQASVPALVTLLVHHRPPALRGRTLIEVMSTSDRQPDRLAAHYRRWQLSPARMAHARPTTVFAALGQAKVEGRLSPVHEDRVIDRMLKQWALRGVDGSRQPIVRSARARSAVSLQI